MGADTQSVAVSLTLLVIRPTVKSCWLRDTWPARHGLMHLTLSETVFAFPTSSLRSGFLPGRCSTAPCHPAADIVRSPAARFVLCGMSRPQSRTFCKTQALRLPSPQLARMGQTASLIRLCDGPLGASSGRSDPASRRAARSCACVPSPANLTVNNKLGAIPGR
jgi:hypothetical protein